MNTHSDNQNPQALGPGLGYIKALQGFRCTSPPFNQDTTEKTIFGRPSSAGPKRLSPSTLTQEYRVPNNKFEMVSHFSNSSWIWLAMRTKWIQHGVLPDIQGSKGSMGYVPRHSSHEQCYSTSKTSWLALPFPWHYFITFTMLSVGSHSISSVQEQKNGPSSKQCERSHSTAGAW